MDSYHTEQHIEALLFYKAEPMRVSEVAQSLGVSEEATEEALQTLEQTLHARGIRLMRKDGSVQLVTAPETSEHIERLRTEELARPLGRAALETLAIVLYRGPLTRSEIDYIRGVNSTFMLRNLLIRGLIERVHNPHDQRSFLYQPTFDLLGQLGITRIEELPEFDTVKREMELFESTLREEEQDNASVSAPTDTPDQSSETHV